MGFNLGPDTDDEVQSREMGSDPALQYASLMKVLGGAPTPPPAMAPKAPLPIAPPRVPIQAPISKGPDPDALASVAKDDSSSPDSISFSASAPDSSQSGVDSRLSQLRDQQANNQAEKRKLAYLGAIADNLSSRQSFGNFFLGKMNPENHSGENLAKTLSNNLVDPYAQADKDAKLRASESQYAKLRALQSPDSEETKSSRALGGVMLESLAKSGVVKPDSPAFQSLQKTLTQGNAMQIQDAIEKSKFLQDLSQQSLAAQKAQSAEAAADRRADRQTERMAAMFGNRNSQQAQRTVNNDPILKTYVQRIDGAKKINELIDAASKGDVKSNQALLGQLNAEISRLETGSQSPGLHAAEKTEMQSAAAKLHNVMDTLTGKVTNVDLGDKFAAARSMVKELGGSYYDQINDRIGFLNSGSLPDQEPVFESKLKYFKDRYKGFDRSGNQPQMAGPGSSGGGLVPSANAGGSPEIRIISSGPMKGKKVKKVNGGWQEVQ